MTAGWAASVPLDQVDAAAALRLEGDVEACEEGGRLWLRGTPWGESLDPHLRKTLGAERYHVLDRGQVADWDCTLASRKLPAGTWCSFREWLRPVAPSTLLPARISKRAPLRLVRTSS